MEYNCIRGYGKRETEDFLESVLIVLVAILSKIDPLNSTQLIKII